MKNIIKFICSFICYLLFIPCAISLTVVATWYLLPAFQTTYLGNIISTTIGKNMMALVASGAIVSTIFFFLMGKLFVVVRGSKALNFYTHTITWLLALVLAAESVYSFIASGVINSKGVELDAIRKIGLLACAVALLLYALISPKVRKLVDRRI